MSARPSFDRRRIPWFHSRTSKFQHRASTGTTGAVSNVRHLWVKRRSFCISAQCSEWGAEVLWRGYRRNTYYVPSSPHKLIGCIPYIHRHDCLRQSDAKAEGEATLTKQRILRRCQGC